MKTCFGRRRNLIYRTMLHTLTGICLMVVLSSGTRGKDPVSKQTACHNSILVKLSQNSKIHRVKLYPNATYEALFFMAEGEEGKLYQLFVFDMDGKLVKRTQVNNRQTTLLSSFEKGDFLIEVFSNDERIENGSITVR